MSPRPDVGQEGIPEVGAPVRLQTHVWNPGGTRRALLLHGLTSDGACWWRLASTLADAGWLVLAPDLRGHGRSPPAAAYDMTSLAEDVALLGSGWDVVVGHSLGGAVAAVLLTMPVHVRAAVLVDPVLALTEPTRAELRAGLRAEAGTIDAAEVARAHPDWDERDVWRSTQASRLATPDVVSAVLDHNDPWDVADHVTRARQRVHLLAADPALGGLLPVALAQSLVDGERVTYELVTGSHHSIQHERPGVVEDAVRRVAGT